MRSNSGIRVHSRENLQPAALRRAPTPNGATKQNGARQKADFSISSPDEGEDDDEWVSSESGAATPNNASDAETTPIEQASKHRPAAQPAPVQTVQQAQVNATAGHDVATPKAAPPSLPPFPFSLSLLPFPSSFSLFPLPSPPPPLSHARVSHAGFPCHYFLNISAAFMIQKDMPYTKLFTFTRATTLPF